MTDLDRVLDELMQAVEGRRRLPVLQPRDVEEVYALFHAQIDRGTEARERAADAAGHPIACGAGCSACCYNVPVALAGEALVIARWLERPENAEVLARFLAAYPAWRVAIAGDVAEWERAGSVDEAREAMSRAWSRRAMCAFNHEGRCTIYPVRPAICRHAHAVDTNAHCQPESDGMVRTFLFAPLDEYVERIRPVSVAIHEALGPGERAKPLCTAVFDQLRGSK